MNLDRKYKFGLVIVAMVIDKVANRDRLEGEEPESETNFSFNGCKRYLT